MKQSYLFILSLLFSSTIFGQNLLATALQDKSQFVGEIPFKFELKDDKWNIKYYQESLNFNDSIPLLELINLSKIQDSSKWNYNELKKIYIVRKGKQINLKNAIKILNTKTKDSLKVLKKEVNIYNSNSREWRSYPISLSRPIISVDGKYAVIAFNYGNNGGKISVYQKINIKWKLIGDITGWAY